MADDDDDVSAVPFRKIPNEEYYLRRYRLETTALLLRFGKTWRSDQHPRDEDGKFDFKNEVASLARKTIESGRSTSRSKTIRACMAIFEASLAELSSQHPTRAAIMRKAAKRVVSSIPTSLLTRAFGAIKSIHCYPSADSLNEKLRQSFGERLDAIAFWGDDQSIHLNGGVETGDDHSISIANAYAHEIAHAIDFEAKLSNTDLWKGAWKKEIQFTFVLGKQASESPEEGFATFAEAAWLKNDIESAYPRCWKAFKEMGCV